MKSKRNLYVTLACTALVVSARADTLELKNGNVLNGKYAGGTAATVRFETSGGVQVLETSQIIALTFTTESTTTSAQPAAPVTAPAAPAAKSVTLPAGTILLVRMADNVSSKNRPGAQFATKLEYDLVVDGVKVIPSGTVIYGKVQSATQAGRAVGRSSLDLRLTQAAIGGTPLPISTSSYQEAGAASIKKAAGGAAAGAAIGAIAGDASKGAAIGATVGALRRGETVTIAPGTLLEFTLTQPLTVRIGGQGTKENNP